MSHVFIRYAAALAVVASTSVARAEYIVFNGTTSGGESMSLGLSANTNAAPFLSETLGDGTLHNRFQLMPNGVTGIIGSWRLDVGSTLGAYYGVDELYDLGAYGVGPFVDTYLYADGHSSLTLEWSTMLECHGGCSRASKIHLDLSSSTGGLFTDAITSSVFQQYTSGSGIANWYEEYHFDGQPVNRDRSLTFTLSAVPEPQAVMMALGGLAMVAGALYRRRA